MLALGAALVFGLLLEFAVFRHLYDRDHLDQVIATFGIILFLNQGVKILWGAAPLSLPMPEMFSGSVVLMPGILYPVWRLVIIGSGLGVALDALSAGEPHPRRHAGARRRHQCRRWCRRSASTSAACS